MTARLQGDADDACTGVSGKLEGRTNERDACNSKIKRVSVFFWRGGWGGVGVRGKLCLGQQG